MSLVDQTNNNDEKPWLFKAGNVANPHGRPKGSKNKLSESCIAELYEHWQVHGKEAIQTVFEKRPHEYLKAVISLVPKEFHITEQLLEEVSDDELVGLVSTLRSAKAKLVGAESSTRTRTAKRKAKS